jgi:GMP synthase-like glutamine amidotransferase
MTRKVWWRRPAIWVLVLLVIVSVLIWTTDFLRWQMVRGLFWRPSAIEPDRQTVVIIDPMHTPPDQNLIMNPAYCLADFVTQLADVNIDIIHYPQADEARVIENNPVCVLISGQTAPWTDYDPPDLEPMFSFLRETSLPVLGICGGHQVIAQAFGAPVAPMGYQELCYIEVELVKDDPILEGLSTPITTFNWHGEEVKEMPAGFDLLGSSELCRIQIFRHHDREIYGVQFHPELSGRKPDGKILLINFLRRAGVSWK